jgi:hypothetical protein
VLLQLPTSTEGWPPWLIIVVVAVPVMGGVAAAYFQARKAGGSPEEQDLRREISEKWKRRGDLIDELIGRVATITEARDAAVKAAEDAHAHRIAAELAQHRAEQQEQQCRTQLEGMRAELNTVQAELAELRQNRES